MMKTGLVLEGGAFRGVFTAGVLDEMLDHGITFDYIVGVSAGAGNGMGFLSGQEGRSRECIKPRNHHLNYYGWKQMAKSGRFLNLDRMFFDYPLHDYPFDFDALRRNKTEMEIVVTNCETGCAEYHSERKAMKRFLTLGKASCSVPVLCDPVEIGQFHYLDGSICDSIPVARALFKGCDRMVVIMTKSIGELPTDYGSGAMKEVMKLCYGRRYPNFYRALKKRAKVYAEQLQLLSRLEEEGKAIVIRPDIEGIKKFELDDDKVQSFYLNGRRAARRNLEKIRQFSHQREYFDMPKASGGNVS